MTIFYAYILDTRGPDGLRYLITCANQETANEWWRAILDQASKGTTGYKDVQRVATQMYSYDSATLNLILTLWNNYPLAGFAGKVFYTLLPNSDGGPYPRISDLPPPSHRDPISGERYFIRSQAVPHVYWLLHPTSNEILASQNARSSFRIERADERSNGHSGNASNVMIGSDDIHINLGFRQGSNVSNGQNDVLKVSGRSYAYKFKDFKYSFAAWDSLTSGTVNWSVANDNIAPDKCKINVMFSEDAGYEWELV